MGYRYEPLDRMWERYDPAKMNAGHNVVAGEEVFFISNPALGLWTYRDRFTLSQEASSTCGLAHRN